MKANGTPQSSFIRSLYFILFVLLFLLSKVCFSQPDYNFSSGSLISGTDRQVGAAYRFTNVKPGFDALVTITSISPGVNVTEMDGASGYPEALQPTLDVSPMTSGYLEMNFTIVNAGTTIPAVQLEIPVTCIDVDGLKDNDGLGNPVNEFDQINLGGGYRDYDMLAGELLVTQSGSWFNGTNIAGIDYPGRDTAARSVMFTVVNANISTFTIRVGVNNLSTKNATRLRSVYFKKFFYPNSFLSAPALSGFTGVVKDKKTSLQWTLSADNSLNKIVVEKSTNATQFSSIGEIWLNTEAKTVAQNGYTDNDLLQGTVYYRLKMVGADGKVQYSNVLVFRADENKKQAFKMYPSVINDNATINISAVKNEQTKLQVVDLSGRAIFQKDITLQSGDNNISVNGFSNLHQGTYIAVMQAGNTTYSQKIMIQ